MTTTRIEKLLEKYYEGLTTLQEERELAAFFCGENVPGNLIEHAAQFRYANHAGQEEMIDPHFEEKFFTAIDQNPNAPVTRRLTRLYFTLSVAASVLLLVGLFFTFQFDYRKKPSQIQSLTSNELSFLQTQDILMKVSLSFNKGVDQMHRLEHFDQAMKRVQVISKFYQYESLVINPEPMESRTIKSTNQ